MLFGFIVFVVAAGAGIGWWIHHRSLKGVISDLSDVKNDVAKVQAAVAPKPVVTTNPGTPPQA